MWEVIRELTTFPIRTEQYRTKVIYCIIVHTNIILMSSNDISINKKNGFKLFFLFSFELCLPLLGGSSY